MTSVNFNPYTWDQSSKAIQSSVTSLELKSGKSEINVSNLHEDIIMVIPIFSQSKSDGNESERSDHRFLKANKMVVHSYYAELPNIPVTMEMSIQETDVVIVELLIRLGSRHTVDNCDYNFTISFEQTCELSKEKINETCTFEKRSVTVVPATKGRLYIGIVGRKNSTHHSRNRRSCFGHGRQKRACVGFKDPPPKAGITKPVVPQYDPSIDVNYTLTITQAGCLYWSEDKDKWTSDGCKVSEDY